MGDLTETADPLPQGFALDQTPVRIVRRLASLIPTAVLVLPAMVGCDGCEKKASAPDVAAVESPVPAPANLLAEAVVATPDSTWSRVQRGVGGVLAIMAPTVGGVAVSLAGAEPWLGAEIDGGSPVYGVVAGSPPGIAIALRLRSAAHVRDSLATDSGRFRAAGEKDGLALFEPTVSGFALGVATSGWLVMGKNKDDVAALGPYAYRTLPTKPLPKANIHFDFLHDGFAGWLGPFAQTKWKAAKAFLTQKDAEARAAHGGREPDFGDAEAIVALSDAWLAPRTDAAADLKSGMLDVDVKDDRINATLSLEPGTGSSKTLADAMRPVPVTIGPMPAAAVVVAMCDDLAGRKETAKATVEGLEKIFGKRLSAKDSKDIGVALDTFAVARGDWLALALTNDAATGDALLVRTPGDHAKDADLAPLLLAAHSIPALRPMMNAVGNGAKNPIEASVKDGAIRIAVGSVPGRVLALPTDDRYAKAFEAVGEASFAIAGHMSDKDPISTIAAKRKDARVEIVVDGTPGMVRDVIKAVASGL